MNPADLLDGYTVAAIQIMRADGSGFIEDAAVRRAYDRIISRGGLSGERSAEAFLRLVLRYARKGIRLVPQED